MRVVRRWNQRKKCHRTIESEFELEHSEGDQYWSRSQVGGGIRTAECHLHRGVDLGNGKKWEYSEEWCMQWSVKDRKQNLGDTAGGCVPGRQIIVTFDTEAARWEIWCEPAENRAMDSEEPGWEASDQNVMVKLSKAAERPRRRRHDTFCDPIAFVRWSWMYKRGISVDWWIVTKNNDISTDNNHVCSY